MPYTHPAPAVETCHQLLAWLIPQLDKFPRLRRHTLGAQMENRLLSVLAQLINASYQRDRHHALSSANTELAIVRHLWRLAWELQAVDQRRWAHGAKLIDGLGRQIGGWQKHSA